MIHLTFKAAISESGKTEQVPLLSQLAISFPPQKAASPGIKASCVAQLESFLNTLANKTSCIEPEDAVPSNTLLAEELRALALLVEKNERVLKATIFHEVDGPLIVLKLKG
jgi:hypothetical protein